MIAEQLVTVEVGTVERLSTEQQAGVATRDLEAAQSPDHTVHVHPRTDRLQSAGEMKGQTNQ